MTRLPVLFVALATAAALLGGCGEKSQVAAYSKGRYAGKTDTRAWDHDRFKHDRAEWERVIKERNLRQDDYARITGKI